MTERPVGLADSAPGANLTPGPLLALVDVKRRFGTRTVLDGVSLTVRPGEVHLVVGPNGSGKSTLERVAAGLLRCHGGQVRVAGSDPRDSAAARRAIGFLGHQSGLYDDLSALENLAFAARLFRLIDPDRVVADVLDRVAVGSDRSVPVRRLSRGTVQRVAIAKSLLHGPQLLVWDEPLTGLDGPSVERVIEVLAVAQSAGQGVVLVSHDLDPLWRLEAQVHLLHRGQFRLTLDTGVPLAEFRRRYGELLDG